MDVNGIQKHMEWKKDICENCMLYNMFYKAQNMEKKTKLACN